MASALSGKNQPWNLWFKSVLGATVGLVGSPGLSTEHFVSCLLKIDYVSNFLSGFPRSLSLRTVLKHKNTKRVSTRGEFKKNLTVGGREGDSCGRQTQRGPPFSASVFWKRRKNKSPVT